MCICCTCYTCFACRTLHGLVPRLDWERGNLFSLLIPLQRHQYCIPLVECLRGCKTEGGAEQTCKDVVTSWNWDGISHTKHYRMILHCKWDAIVLVYFLTADGSCVVWSVQDPAHGVTKLTGPELDEITSVRRVGGSVYTSCRDGNVRVYSVEDMWPGGED